MEWYYANAGQRAGPVDESELHALYAAGQVRRDTLVWKAGMTEWQPLSTVQPSFSVAVQPNTNMCTECRAEFEAADLLTFGSARVCAGCKDVFFQRVREQGTEVAAEPATKRSFRRYGGFWIRLVARILDSVILWVVLLPMSYAMGVFLPDLWRPHPVTPDIRSFGPLFGALAILNLFSWTIALLYEGWFVSNRGGTPGKLLFGLRIVRPTGDKLSFSRACGRYLATIASGLTLFIGYIMAAFDDQKRALHDYICDTRVLYKST